MAHAPFLIDLRTLPPEGKDISGTVPASFFALLPTDDVQATSPLVYELHVQVDGKDLLVHGELDASFSLTCGRCVEVYPHRVHLPFYHAEIELEGENSTMDLTDDVREDILLALPSYPRCEDGNVETRECPARGRFQSESDDETPPLPPAQDPAVWDVLDKLQKNS